MRLCNVNARLLALVFVLIGVFVDAYGRTQIGKSGIYLGWGIGLLGVLGLVIFVMIRVKHRRAEVKHPEAMIQNWDYNRTIEYIRFVFRQVQTSWMNRDIDSISEYVTSSFYKRFESQYYLMLSKGEKDIISSITIKSVEIQSMHDKIDEDATLLNVYVTSEMVVYTLDEKLRQIVFNVELKPSEYILNLQFVKENNRWLVNDIQNVNTSTSTSDIFTLKVR